MAEFDRGAYAPTPGNDRIMLVLQILAALRVALILLDAKSAFCQGRKLRRRRGPIFATPCDGVGLQKDDLIELVCALYGLRDAPAEWRRTLCEALCGIGLRVSLV